jgi:hypothetical protein
MRHLQILDVLGIVFVLSGASLFWVLPSAFRRSK